MIAYQNEYLQKLQECTMYSQMPRKTSLEVDIFKEVNFKVTEF